MNSREVTLSYDYCRWCPPGSTSWAAKYLNNVVTLLNQELVARMLQVLTPLGHHSCAIDEAIQRADLGLGIIYYSLVRVLKPQKILAVGSLRGFSVVCMALALEDNGAGDLDFVDAARVDDFWKNEREAKQHFADFGVCQRVNLHVMTTSAYIAKRSSSEPHVEFLFLDGDHSKKGVQFDHESLGRLVVPGGYVAFHDSLAAGVGFTEWEVADYLGSLHNSLFEILSLRVGQGLTVLRKLSDDVSRDYSLSAGHSELAELARALDQQHGDDLTKVRPLASLALTALRGARERDRIYQSRVQFLTKANDDLRKELKKLRRMASNGS